MSKNRLGAGAASLLGGLSIDHTNRIQQVLISQIVPNEYQPRQHFDQEKLQELAQSIKQNGILQPLIVEQKGLSYTLVAGERRLRAAEIAGIREVPVIVKSFTHEQKVEIALVENIQREDLTPIELAKSYKELINLLSFSHEELAIRIGKSRSTITNALRLLQLPAIMQKALDKSTITAGHARALLSLENQPEVQQELYDLIIKEDYSVRQAEKYAQAASNSAKEKNNKNTTSTNATPPSLNRLEKKLMEYLGVKLQIKGDEHRGTIAIRYHSQEKLNHIVTLLENTSRNS